MGLRLRLRPRLARLSGSCWKRRKALPGRARQEVRKEANLIKILLELCEDTSGWRCLRLVVRGVLLRLLLRPRLRLLRRLRLGGGRAGWRAEMIAVPCRTGPPPPKSVRGGRQRKIAKVASWRLRTWIVKATAERLQARRLLLHLLLLHLDLHLGLHLG